MNKRVSLFPAIILCLVTFSIALPTAKGFQSTEAGDGNVANATGESKTGESGDSLKDDRTGPPSLLQQLFGSPLTIMVIALGLFYLMVLRPQQAKEKEKQREREEALGNMKKNFRVVTAGGIHGTVTASNKETETVTIRIDESSGAKMTVNIGSIVSIVDPNAKESSDS